MSLVLRPYQSEMILKTRAKLRDNKAVLLTLPTGGGKTAIAAHIIDGAKKKGNQCFFIVHRRELIDQTMEAFTLQGIPFGVIAAGYGANPFEPIQICSIGTLQNRLDKTMIKPRVIIFDECHHCVAGGWKKVFSAYPDAKIIGLSATPERVDGQGLGELYTAMVLGPDIKWLTENGFLAKYRIFGSEVNADLSNVGTSMGDYAKGDLSSAMDKPTITGDAIAHYLKYARDKRFLAFAASREHSKHIAEQFCAAGIMSVHVDGETDKNDRRQAMQGFRAGTITGLINVDLFGEGVDVPAAECLIDLAPSKSLGKVMQRWGRVLRPSEGKEYAIILDHSGNWKRHGFPDDARIWSLASKKRKPKSESDSVDVRQCKNCSMVHRRAPTCPACGYIYPVNSREIDYVEGNLTELSREQKKARNRAQLIAARTLPELVTLGILWQIPNPELWAERIVADRKEYKKKQIRGFYERKRNS